MTQPPNETPDVPEEAIGGVPTEAPTTGGDDGADGAAGDGGADGAAGDGAAGDGGADGGA